MKQVTLSDDGDVQVSYDEQNRDVLIGRRLEVLFTPNDDAAPSLEGQIRWHTEWVHYTGTIVRGKSLGPIIELTLGEVYNSSSSIGDLPGADIINSVKLAYAQHALAFFNLVPPVVEELPEMPV